LWTLFRKVDVKTVECGKEEKTFLKSENHKKRENEGDGILKN